MASKYIPQIFQPFLNKYGTNSNTPHSIKSVNADVIKTSLCAGI